MTVEFIKKNGLACLDTNQDGLVHLCPKKEDEENLQLVFDPYGFTDVVALWTPKHNPDSLAGTKGRICTGVRVSDQYILSALHCLGGIRKSDGQAANPSARALWHKIDHSNIQPVAGVAGWTKIVLSDDFQVRIYMNNSPFGTILVDGWSYIKDENRLKIGAATVFLPIPVEAFQTLGKFEKYWPTHAKNSGNPDLLLIRLDQPAKLKNDRFSVMATEVDADVLRQFTFVGFGKTSYDGRKKFTQSILAALSFLGRRDGKLVGWSRNDALGGSVPCQGDSGGPLFAGMNFGLPNEPHILLGLVRDTPDTPDDNGCGLNRGRATAIDVYRDDICKITQNEAAGCKYPN